MFLIKIITTVFYCFFLLLGCRKINTKFAGIISGMPLRLIGFQFLGAELASIYFGERCLCYSGITGTLAFSILYYYASSPDWCFSPILSLIWNSRLYANCICP